MLLCGCVCLCEVVGENWYGCKCVACTRVHNNTKYICNNNDINDTQKYIDDDDKQQLQLRRRPFGVKDDYGD